MPVYVGDDIPEQPELVELRALRDRVAALLKEPGHITRAELTEALTRVNAALGSTDPERTP